MTSPSVEALGTLTLFFKCCNACRQLITLFNSLNVKVVYCDTESTLGKSWDRHVRSSNISCTEAFKPTLMCAPVVRGAAQINGRAREQTSGWGRPMVLRRRVGHARQRPGTRRSACGPRAGRDGANVWSKVARLFVLGGKWPYKYNYKYSTSMGPSRISSSIAALSRALAHREQSQSPLTKATPTDSSTCSRVPSHLSFVPVPALHAATTLLRRAVRQSQCRSCSKLPRLPSPSPA